MRIGMALHVGWAIEGPIGSDYKIDASYLSPAVSMCEMLECSTKVTDTLAHNLGGTLQILECSNDCLWK